MRRGVLILILLAIGTLPVATADASLSAWQSAPQLPADRTQFAFATGGGAVYVFGGFSGGGEFKNATAWTFDPATQLWSDLQPIPKLRCCATAVHVPDGRFILVGGATGGLVNDAKLAWAYTPATNSWARIASTPETLLDGQDAVLAGGTHRRVYALGANLYKYDQTTNTWTTLNTRLPQRRVWFSMVAIKANIYVIGGATPGTLTDPTQYPQATVWRYNLTSKTWTRLAPMLSAEESATAVVGSDGNIYVIGGVNLQNSPTGTSAVQVYDPAMNSWSLGPPLPSPRIGAGAVRIGDTIYVIGGDTSSRALETATITTP